MKKLLSTIAAITLTIYSALGFGQPCGYPAPIPDLVGLTPQQAELAWKHAGFNTSVIFESLGDSEVIISQSIEPGIIACETVYITVVIK